jgi:hypothetical protein
VPKGFGCFTLHLSVFCARAHTHNHTHLFPTACAHFARPSTQSPRHAPSISVVTPAREAASAKAPGAKAPGPPAPSLGPGPSWLDTLLTAASDGDWVLIDKVPSLALLHPVAAALLRCGLGNNTGTCTSVDAGAQSLDPDPGTAPDHSGPTQSLGYRRRMLTFGDRLVSVHPQFRLFLTVDSGGALVAPCPAPVALTDTLNVVDFSPTKREVLDGVLDTLTTTLQPQLTTRLRTAHLQFVNSLLKEVGG